MSLKAGLVPQTWDKGTFAQGIEIKKGHGCTQLTQETRWPWVHSSRMLGTHAPLLLLWSLKRDTGFGN